MARPSNTAERREQIVAGLLEVMAEQGYERASVASVARAAGLAPGLVHYHFGSKQDILLQLIGRLAATRAERLEARLARAKSARGRLKAFVDVHLALGEDADSRELACWVAVAAEAIRQPEVRAAYDAALEDTLARLRALVCEALREAGRSTRDAPRLSAAVLASIQGYCVVAATSPGLIPRRSAAPTLWKLLQGALRRGARGDPEGRSPPGIAEAAL